MEVQTTKATWNKKVAKNRGASWKSALKKGKIEARLKPSSIRKARIDLKIKQDSMALKLKIAPSTYGAIERGHRMVQLDLAEDIAKILRQPVNKFFKNVLNRKYLAIVAA